MSAEFNVDQDGNVTMTVDGEEVECPFQHLADLEGSQSVEQADD